MAPRNAIENLGESLGEYLREQRTSAKLSLRQLADLAGVSNPYLSQIERGLKRPSAEILQELAKGLQISAETLYVKAGFLDERTVSEHRPWDVEAAITADPALTGRQKDTLIDIYRSFVGEPTHAMERASEDPAPNNNAAPVTVAPQPRTRARATKKSGVKKATAKKATAKKTNPKKTGATTKKATSSTRKPGATSTSVQP